MQLDLSHTEKAGAAEKFLGYLKSKYPIANCTITSEYVDAPYLHTKASTASVQKSGDNFHIKVSTSRDINRVLQSVPHEFCHVLQTMVEGIPFDDIGRKQERQAWAFSCIEYAGYMKEVGHSWL